MWGNHKTIIQEDGVQLRLYLKHADLPFSGWEVFEGEDGVQKDVFVQRYKTFEREQTQYYIDVDTLDELKSLQSLLGSISSSASKKMLVSLKYMTDLEGSYDAFQK